MDSVVDQRPVKRSVTDSDHTLVKPSVGAQAESAMPASIVSNSPMEKLSTSVPKRSNITASYFIERELQMGVTSWTVRLAYSAMRGAICLKPIFPPPSTRPYDCPSSSHSNISRSLMLKATLGPHLTISMR